MSGAPRPALPGSRLRSAIPGYRRMRKLAIRTVRRSQRLRKLVAGARSNASSRRTLSIRPGFAFATGEARDTNIVVVVALGLTAEHAATTAARLAEAQLMSAAFRSLVVLDSPEFGPFRRHGIPVELVMNRTMYAQLHDASGYTAYVSRRISAIVDNYGAASVLPLPATGVHSLAIEALLAVAATPR